MFAVIFEVWPNAEGRQQYLDLAAALLPLLDDIDGVIAIERFSRLSEPGKLLSLSFFRDEAALAPWRQQARRQSPAPRCLAFSGAARPA